MNAIVSIITDYLEFYLDILSYEGGFVVINREFKDTYNDTNSIEYLQFSEEVATVVSDCLICFKKYSNQKI